MKSISHIGNVYLLVAWVLPLFGSIGVATVKE